MSSTIQTGNPKKIYDNETHKLNTELQIALLKWKINSLQKETKFEF